MKILIVDDNDINRKLLRASLEVPLHSVLAVCNGKPAPISTIQIALDVAAAKKEIKNSNIQKAICFEMSRVQTGSIQVARGR